MNICQDELKEFNVYKNQKHINIPTGNWERQNPIQNSKPTRFWIIGKVIISRGSYFEVTERGFFLGIFTTQSTLQNLYIIIINRSVKYVTYSKVVARWSPGNKLP